MALKITTIDGKPFTLDAKVVDEINRLRKDLERANKHLDMLRPAIVTLRKLQGTFAPDVDGAVIEAGNAVDAAIYYTTLPDSIKPVDLFA